ncbi:hypothetical protein LTR53_012122 [Teratosphaeriaceae sp. CCFEE 6253]|nr:hypothetical protein LTR53_012122 [Teratosphaeriaceae sp. CCFEE 6253]
MADDAYTDAGTGKLARLMDRDLTSLDDVRLFCAAAKGGHAKIVHWLINERFPAFTPHLQSHLAAIAGGPDVYAFFLARWPHLMTWDLGHNGNPLGYSAFCGDKDMVAFLLSRGADPNVAHFIHRPLWRYPDWVVKDGGGTQILDLMIAHGFHISEVDERRARQKGSVRQKTSLPRTCGIRAGCVLQ